jgi:hypothetical protein
VKICSASSFCWHKQNGLEPARFLGASVMLTTQANASASVRLLVHAVFMILTEA